MNVKRIKLFPSFFFLKLIISLKITGQKGSVVCYPQQPVDGDKSLPLQWWH